MSVQKVIFKAAKRVLIELATNRDAQEKAQGLIRGALDMYQVRAGKVNLQSSEDATESAIEFCIRDDEESQTRVAAFVSALYLQHDIHRGAQVGGSLRKRFGPSWFPHIKEREERYALDVDKELEDYLYDRIQSETDV